MSLNVLGKGSTSGRSIFSVGLVFSSLDLTSLVFSLVWVVGFSGKTLLDDVRESADWVSSVTSEVSVGDTSTVNQLLFGEVGELLVGKEPPSFNVSGSGEGPTGSTLSLVLNGGDGSLGGPVEWGNVGLSDFFFFSSSRSTFVLGLVSQVLADEFFLGDIHEFGFSQNVLGLHGVFSLDVEVVSEIGDQLGFFDFKGFVSLVEGEFPLLEFLNDVSWDSVVGFFSSQHLGFGWGNCQESCNQG